MYDALQVVSDKAEARGEARGREIGEARGREIGEARGREIGEARGENRMGQLLQKLLNLGRIDDVKRIAEDAEYRGQLMREFAIQ